MEAWSDRVDAVAAGLVLAPILDRTGAIVALRCEACTPGVERLLGGEGASPVGETLVGGHGDPLPPEVGRALLEAARRARPAQALTEIAGGPLRVSALPFAGALLLVALAPARPLAALASSADAALMLGPADDDEPGRLRVRDANDRAAALFARAPRQLLGCTIGDLVSEDLAGALDALLARALETGRAQEEVLALAVPLAPVRWLAHQACPLVDGCVTLLSRDVTRQRGRELELWRQREESVAVLEALYDGLYVVGSEGEIEQVNRRLVALTGYARRQLLGARRPYPFWPREEAARLRALEARAEAEGVAEAEVVLRRRGGGRLSAILSLSARVGERGQPMGIVATVKDVTDPRTEAPPMSEARRSGP